MSSMRLGLLALGVLFVLAVWMFNKLQERRIRRRVEAPFSQPRRDVLLDREISEHVSRAGAPVPMDDPKRAEPRFVAREAASDDASPTLAEGLSEERQSILPFEIDAPIHALIPLTIEQPVSGDRVLASLAAFRHAGRQNVLLLGGREGLWYPVRAMERFDALLVAIQLANRSGPLNEVEFSEFVTRLESAAEQIPATCDAPEMIETIARARSLDASCAPLDAQIGLTLANPEGVWAGELIALECEAQGMVLRSDGRFHATLDEAVTLFTLQNADGPAFRVDNLEKLATSRITFVLDVPTVAQELDPYRLMTRAAQSMASRLGAVIVDDQLRTLTPTMLEAIARQIEPVYAKLDAAGMSAGSRRALALFS
jgi:hypothetical protein